MKKIVNWFKSYGYYYKWHFVFGAFALILIVLLVAQLFTRTEYSIYMTYAGPEAISLEKLDDIKHSVKSVMRSELKAQGHEISVRDILYVNTKLAIDYKENDLFFSAQSNSEAVKLLNQEIAVGDSFIYIIDKEQYEKIRDNNALTPLSQIFSAAPESKYDDYGIVFTKTDFASYFSCYDSFTEDMILCLRRDTSDSTIAMFKKGDTKDSFELHKKVFIDIVSFSVPETSETTATP